MVFTINPLVYVIIFGVILGIIIKSIIGKKKSKPTITESKPEYTNTWSETEKIISNVLFVIGGIPLCVYPFVLIANLMSLAGYRAGNVNILSVVVVYLFIFVTSTYPLTYLMCIFRYFKRGKKIFLSVIPLIHIVIAIGLGFPLGIFGN
jgi:hypothetical protein